MNVGTSASVPTIRHALKGLHDQTPFLSIRNIKNWLEYAMRNRDKTTEFWKTFL